VTESWDLKLDRADHHLTYVAGIVARFSDSHPYEAVDTGYRKGHVRKYKLRMTAQPDEMLAVIVGDVIHNLRSALDHLVVAAVPNNRRGKAGFPIYNTSPFGVDGMVLDNEVGEGWTKLTKGLSDPLLAVVKSQQPFEPPDQEVLDFCRDNGLDPRDVNGLSLLGRFDNADKHRELLPVASGIDGGTVTVRHGDLDPIEHRLLDGFREDGTELIKVNFGSPTDDAKVDVQVTGTVRVALEVRKERGVTRLPGTLERLLDHCRDLATVFTTIQAG